jgi:hypothetical protein
MPDNDVDWKALALQMYDPSCQCWYDHDDNCQEHHHSNPCPHEVITDHLKEQKRVTG